MKHSLRKQMFLESTSTICNELKINFHQRIIIPRVMQRQRHRQTFIGKGKLFNFDLCFCFVLSKCFCSKDFFAVYDYSLSNRKIKFFFVNILKMSRMIEVLDMNWQTWSRWVFGWRISAGTKFSLLLQIFCLLFGSNWFFLSKRTRFVSVEIYGENV